MRRNYFAILTLLVTLAMRPQQFQWVQGICGPGTEIPYGTTIDSLGNIYMTGVFSNTVDFDPGAGVITKTAVGTDPFILKLDVSGNLIWVKHLEGNGTPYSITLDNAGNVIALGKFIDSIDIDPSVAQNKLYNSSGCKYIVKLDNNGNFIWGKQFGNTVIYGYYDKPSALVADKNGNMFVAGCFAGADDFDPGQQVYSLTTAGMADVYLMKLNSLGDLIWVKKFGSTSDDWMYGCGLDSLSNFYITGTYFGTVDFDPGVGINNMSPGGCYIMKVDSAGSFIWAKTITSGSSKPKSFNILPDGTGYFCGDSWAAYNFDPDGINTPQTFYGNVDAFVGKFDSYGNISWFKSYGSTGYEYGDALTSDKSGNVYLTGRLDDSLDMDFGAGVYFINAGTFTLKMTPLSNFVFAFAFGSTIPATINTDLTNNFVITGATTTNNLDYDYSAAFNTIQTSGAGFDSYILKYSQDTCSQISVDFDSVLMISCLQPGYAHVNVSGPSIAPNFNWNTTPSSTNNFAYFQLPGLYSVMYTDSLNCIKNRQLLINGPELQSFNTSTNLVTTTFRPGVSSVLWVDGFNFGCDTISGVLSWINDNKTTLGSTSLSPDSISGDTLFWNFSALNYDSAHITPIINVTTSQFAQIGDTVCFEVFITPIAGDADTTNNHKTYCFPVVNGYDPNDISVFPQGICPEKYVLNDQKLTYTIRFQNTGNSNAININVLDSLDSDLDLNSVRVIANSHPLITEVLPGNVLKFRFDNIMLPDSGSNEPASHGYVIYEVDPLPSLTNGTQIKNQADIYFDFNPPVITNEVMNTIIDSIPACSITTGITSTKNSSIKVYPNPAKDVLYVEGVEAGAIITIYDYSGRLVQSKKSFVEKCVIETGNLQNGIYLIGVSGAHETSFVKVIIQK